MPLSFQLPPISCACAGILSHVTTCLITILYIEIRLISDRGVLLSPTWQSMLNPTARPPISWSPCEGATSSFLSHQHALPKILRTIETRQRRYPIFPLPFHLKQTAKMRSGFLAKETIEQQGKPAELHHFYHSIVIQKKSVH